jgi:hypothetical protein
VRAVRCEKCQTEFVYVVSREGLGYGVSLLYLDNAGAQDQARMRAEAELRRELARGHEPVPCPGCGWYQRSMIPLLRQAHWRGLTIAGAFFLYLAALLLVLGVAAWFSDMPRHEESARQLVEACGWVAGIGLGLILARKVLAWRLRPNEGDPEPRMALARKVAITREEFERALRAEERPSAE